MQEERQMKITDVTLTLFAWDDIPATTYGIHTGSFKGDSRLGLLRIRTNDGVEGQPPSAAPPSSAPKRSRRGRW
jgi:hypothetical protein